MDYLSSCKKMLNASNIFRKITEKKLILSDVYIGYEIIFRKKYMEINNIKIIYISKIDAITYDDEVLTIISDNDQIEFRAVEFNIDKILETLGSKFDLDLTSAYKEKIRAIPLGESVELIKLSEDRNSAG